MASGVVSQFPTRQRGRAPPNHRQVRTRPSRVPRLPTRRQVLDRHACWRHDDRRQLPVVGHLHRFAGCDGPKNLSTVVAHFSVRHRFHVAQRSTEGVARTLHAAGCQLRTSRLSPQITGPVGLPRQLLRVTPCEPCRSPASAVPRSWTSSTSRSRWPVPDRSSTPSPPPAGTSPTPTTLCRETYMSGRPRAPRVGAGDLLLLAEVVSHPRRVMWVKSS